MKLPPTPLTFIRLFQLYSSSCCWFQITAAGYEFWIWLYFQIHTEKHKHAELNWVILLLGKAAEMWRWIRWGCEIRFDGDHLWGQSEGGLSCLLDQNGIEPSSTWFGLVAQSWKTISPLAGFFYSFAMCGLVMIALSIPDGCLFVAQQPIDRPNKLVVGFHGQQHRQTHSHIIAKGHQLRRPLKRHREWIAYLTDSRKIFWYRFLSSLETRHSRNNWRTRTKGNIKWKDRTYALENNEHSWPRWP